MFTAIAALALSASMQAAQTQAHFYMEVQDVADLVASGGCSAGLDRIDETTAPDVPRELVANWVGRASILFLVDIDSDGRIDNFRPVRIAVEGGSRTFPENRREALIEFAEEVAASWRFNSEIDAGKQHCLRRFDFTSMG